MKQAKWLRHPDQLGHRHSHGPQKRESVLSYGRSAPPFFQPIKKSPYPWTFINCINGRPSLLMPRDPQVFDTIIICVYIWAIDYWQNPTNLGRTRTIKIATCMESCSLHWWWWFQQDYNLCCISLSLTHNQLLDKQYNVGKAELGPNLNAVMAQAMLPMEYLGVCFNLSRKHYLYQTVNSFLFYPLF